MPVGAKRAAYKKQVLGLSSKPAPSIKRLQNCAYFGRTVGSPPGLPGGGITGVLPASGVGARISGSTPVGGHNTPSDLASLSPSGSPLTGCALAHRLAAAPVAQSNRLRARAQAGRRRRGRGGACALATPDAASTHARKIEVSFSCGENGRRAEVPDQADLTCGCGKRKIAPQDLR
jgi:hypothetical protein